MQAHLERELSFFHAGVAIDDERREVEQALRKAGMRIVADVLGSGFRALGGASEHFDHTAVRVITRRGVVAGVDADRDDVLHPARLHLLESTPRNVGPLSLVAWVRIPEGDTAGCASLFHVSGEGFLRRMAMDVSTAGDVACLGALLRREGALWGSLVWPGFSLEETPALEIPLALESLKLDAEQLPSRLVQRDVDGWTGPARAERLRRLDGAEGFAARHAPALELAAIELFEGQSLEAQRATYARYAGPPSGHAEMALWRLSTALIERGWLSASTQAPAGEPASANDVLQDADYGQEAQQEEARDAR